MNNFFIFLLCYLLLCACNPLKKISFAPHTPFDEKEISNQLRIEFNGVATFYIQYKGSAVLTDPFITNPSFRKVSFGKIMTDTVLLNRYAPKAHNIKLVSMGHAHYDHILDLPYFIPKLKSETKIVGSKNAVALANTLLPRQEVIDISVLKSSIETHGTWVYAADSTMRIMAIKSAHLPHIACKHLYCGSYTTPPKNFPQKGKHFLQDETLAYLIDFLSPSLQPEKRIYFSSSAVSYPNGFFPAEMLNEKVVDVAILSAALSQKAEDYPTALLQFLKPEKTIICHWENFFRNRDKKLKAVSLTNHQKFQKALDELKAITEIHFIKPGNSWVVE
jgi:L-ascorbate metabolism protein UlaG (beta-lactamase superfamily)